MKESDSDVKSMLTDLPSAGLGGQVPAVELVSIRAILYNQSPTYHPWSDCIANMSDRRPN